MQAAQLSASGRELLAQFHHLILRLHDRGQAGKFDRRSRLPQHPLDEELRKDGIERSRRIVATEASSPRKIGDG
jgi:hypothetical protein